MLRQASLRYADGMAFWCEIGICTLSQALPLSFGSRLGIFTL
jgi:hypothetical protein